MIKRLSAYLVIVMVVLAFDTSYGLPAAAFGDIGEIEQREAIETLVSLGFVKGYDDNTFKPDETMSKAEFAELVASVFGGATGSAGEAQYYYDVGKEHWAYESIQYLTARGLLHNMGRVFNPNAPQDVQSAVRTAVDALGYDMQAEAQGGFPTGYMAVASRLGILKKTGALNTVFSRAKAIQFLYNMIEIDMCKPVSYGETTSYEIKKGHTIISEYLKIYTKKGIVTADSYSSFSGNSAVGSGEVEITEGGNAEVFLIGDSGIDKLLGYSVKLYYKTNNEDEKTVLTASIDSVKNEIVTHQARDIKADSTDKSRITVYIGSKFRQYKLSNTVDLIYNGKVLHSYTKDIFDFKSGNITLIDNKSDDGYDVIIINEYSDYVVNGIDLANDTVYDKYTGSHLVLKDYGAGSKVSILKDGEKASLSDVKEWDVISVLKSSDDKIINAEIVTKKVTGILNEYDIDEGFVSIGDVQYELSAYFADALKTSGSKANIPAIGETGVFCLNKFGMIAAVYSLTATQRSYGYIVNAGQASGLGKGALIKMLTSGGSLEIYECASKVIIDGLAVKSGAAVLDTLRNTGYTLSNSGGTEATYNQVIKYALNLEGEIIYIDTSSPNISVADKEDENALTLDLDSPGLKYLTENHGFGGRVLFDSTTSIFLVPSPMLPGAATKDKLYKKLDASYLPDNDYVLRAYDISRSGVAKAAAVTPVNGYDDDSVLGMIYNWTALTLVESVTTVLSSDGEATVKIYGYEYGQPVTYAFKNAAIGEGISTGDVIRVGTNEKGEVDIVDGAKFSFDNMYSFANNIISSSNPNDFYASYTNYCAKIYDAYGATVKVKIGNDFNYLNIERALSEGLYFMRISNGKCFKGTIGDIVGIDNVPNANMTLVAQTLKGVVRAAFVIIDDRD